MFIVLQTQNNLIFVRICALSNYGIMYEHFSEIRKLQRRTWSGVNPSSYKLLTRPVVEPPAREDRCREPAGHNKT